MKFNVTLNSEDEIVKKLRLSEFAEFVLRDAFDFGKFDSVDVSINFVDTKQIHSLNKQFRDIDNPTDVLSFECDGAEINGSSIKPADISIFDLGDIFICKEVAVKNAEKFLSTLDNEILLLTVHGLLHLCGYDHINEAEANIMEAREEELLSKWERHV